jgi:hypothetical protein
MTHTNHRTGDRQSLSRDWVVFMYPAKGINDRDAGPRLQAFMKLGCNHGPVNGGPARTGDRFIVEPGRVVERISRASSAYLVFDSREKAEALVMDVAKADMGISVIVSGLFEEVDCMCQKAGIKRHTEMGRTELLPRDEEVLDIATMCGHSMVGFNLIRKLADDVRDGRTSLDEAARVLARPCSCGVFNPTRAGDLLKQYNDRRATARGA